jgi:transcriptional regulator with XRE-family HTH domain
MKGKMERKGLNLRQILAANLKEQRKILGVSQEKLAEMAGLSWQTINSLECQRVWASDATLESIAQIFNIDAFQLLMPPEIRASLALNSADALFELAQAKRAYDEIFSDVYSRIT